MKCSGRAATSATIWPRSGRWLLSTSITRRPRPAYSASSALISDDLPVPRAPVSSTLLAGRPARNCSVLRTISAFWRSMSFRSARRTVCGAWMASSQPLRPARHQRKAGAVQSGSGNGRRQQRLQARHQGFGAGEKGFQFVHCSSDSGGERFFQYFQVQRAIQRLADARVQRVGLALTGGQVATAQVVGAQLGAAGQHAHAGTRQFVVCA